jgi:conjugative transfer signal peptidase TraF
MSRRHYVLAACAGLALLAVPAFASFTPRLIWNASASTPIGLYAISAAGTPKRGDLVAVEPPQPLADFLADGGYLPRGLPLIKHVAAVPGQRVCRIGRVITIDGARAGEALDHDHRGRPLPTWDGCRRVVDGELFFMNAAVTGSFDGRYFGPIGASAVIGRATPLYTDERGDGRFVWRAAAQ